MNNKRAHELRTIKKTFQQRFLSLIDFAAKGGGNESEFGSKIKMLKIY